MTELVPSLKLKVTPCYLSGICWDQWFPEAARAMVLKGAEILFYPTAIGSEPQDEGLDSRDHWKRVMQGHAGANLVSFLEQHHSYLNEYLASDKLFFYDGMIYVVC